LTPCYRIEEKRVELVPDADGYRLPTSAEWEYAALAGNAGFFWFGDPPNLANTPRGQWNKKYDRWPYEFEWIGAQSPPGTHPVGTKPANPFGLHDVHGNVEEWCWDWFHIYSENSELLVDPLGPSSGTAKVLRGAPFIVGGYQLPVMTGPFRRGLALENSINHYPGIRVVRVIPLVPDDNK
jgi:formylglycine-generating enzyme required for sulfatase activity